MISADSTAKLSLDLEPLHAFLVLIEAGNFSEAARRLVTTEDRLRIQITELGNWPGHTATL